MPTRRSFIGWAIAGIAAIGAAACGAVQWPKTPLSGVAARSAGQDLVIGVDFMSNDLGYTIYDPMKQIIYRVVRGRIVSVHDCDGTDMVPVSTLYPVPRA